jgi:hypothetical protein
MRWIARAPSAAEINDPLAAMLWTAARDDIDPVGRFMGLSALFPAALRDDAVVRDALLNGWQATASDADLHAALASLARL